MTSDIPHSWDIHSFDDVRRLWLSVRDVPGRTQGRAPFHEERYCLGLYLLALGTHSRLAYPLQIEQGRQHESPDFMLTWASGEVTGLEVTRATKQELQRAMKEGERECLRRKNAASAFGEKPEPVILPLDDGLVDDEAEKNWCSLVRNAIEAKLQKFPRFRPASRYDLVVYDVTGVVSRRTVDAALRGQCVGSFDTAAPKLGTVSVIVSLDVIFDLCRRPRLLPYIDWNAPKFVGHDELSELSERIEYAGTQAAKRALQLHAEKHNPVYSIDSSGRLVKQTFDGQRFEVRVGADGAEVVVARLS